MIHKKGGCWPPFFAFLEIPKGMAVRLLCNPRRQVTPSGHKYHKPPLFMLLLACHSRRESHFRHQAYIIYTHPPKKTKT